MGNKVRCSLPINHGIFSLSFVLLLLCYFIGKQTITGEAIKLINFSILYAFYVILVQFELLPQFRVLQEAQIVIVMIMTTLKL
jgi:hypothetical protein